MPERSFFIKGYQFPVCARCTGVLIGYVAAPIIHFFVGTSVFLCITGCQIMLVDWLIQYAEIKESTNIRRLITGIMGGYGVMGIQILCALWIVKLIFI